MNLGTRLKNLRIKKGLSQRELAKIINCGHQSIAEYEKNSNISNIHNIIRICNYFDVSTDYLLNGVPQIRIDNITNEEMNLILKYRLLSEYYKTVIEAILDKGERTQKEQESS